MLMCKKISVLLNYCLLDWSLFKKSRQETNPDRNSLEVQSQIVPQTDLKLSLTVTVHRQSSQHHLAQQELERERGLQTFP